MARTRDGVRRVGVSVYINEGITSSAAQNKLTNSQFIEWLFKNARKSEIPDDMPLSEMQAKYVELDRSLRALNMVIAEKQGIEEKAKLEAAAVLESQKNAAVEADKQKAAHKDYSQWWRALPVERTKALLQEREIALAKVPMNEQDGLRDLFKRQWEELWRKETA